jgi:hypothetical protein
MKTVSTMTGRGVASGRTNAPGLPSGPMAKLMTSRTTAPGADLSPAAHSPVMLPEATLSFAAMMASRNVHAPSLATVSLLLLTVMVAAAVGRASAAAIANAAKTRPPLFEKFMVPPPANALAGHDGRRAGWGAKISRIRASV